MNVQLFSINTLRCFEKSVTSVANLLNFTKPHTNFHFQTKDAQLKFSPS